MNGQANASMTVPEQVAEHVRLRIARLALKRNDALPSYRELARELNVAMRTAKRGVDLLVEQGVVRCQMGQGCFVNRELAPQGRPLKTVGIIHTASQKHLFSAPYLGQIMQGITDGPLMLDVHIFTMREHGFVTAAQLADRHVDGAVLLGVENDDFLSEFATWGVPGVVADQCADDIPLDFVVCDNEDGTRRAVQRLVELGHRRIRYVGSDPHRIALVEFDKDLPLELRSSDYIERREAARRTLAAIPGVRWDDVILSTQDPVGLMPPSPDGVKSVVATWLQETARPTALLTDSDSGAFDLLEELAKQGVSVPGDVSVCAVAGAGVSAPDGRRLTQSRFDFIDMGRQAVELLRLRCECPTDALPPAIHRIGYEFQEGNTVTAVNGYGKERKA